MAQELNPYLKYLGEKSPIAVLESTAPSLKKLADGTDAARLLRSPAPGKWSVRDILCHLADCELVFGFRLRQTVAEDNPTIQPFDQDHWAKDYAKMDAQQALSVFSALRAWNLAFIRAAGPSAMQRKTTHPERGEMTFETILKTMGGHDINHLGQVEALMK